VQALGKLLLLELLIYRYVYACRRCTVLHIIHGNALLYANMMLYCAAVCFDRGIISKVLHILTTHVVLLQLQRHLVWCYDQADTYTACLIGVSVTQYLLMQRYDVCLYAMHCCSYNRMR
jgi:hypothetical protein